MKKEVRIFRTGEELAEAIALDFVNRIKAAQKRKVTLTVAVSGGNTPKLFLNVIAKKYSESVDWSYVQFFWVDERCVPPDDPESNYGMIREILFSSIKVPEKNIHRIRGEEDPYTESVRYSGEIVSNTRSHRGIPEFDLIILGLGDDGHTASIFPGNLTLFASADLCDVTVHPLSGQKRITLTGKVINNSAMIIFLVAGEKKANVVEDIMSNTTGAKSYPAYYINPESGNVIWMIDEKAAGSVREA